MLQNFTLANAALLQVDLFGFSFELEPQAFCEDLDQEFVIYDLVYKVDFGGEFTIEVGEVLGLDLVGDALVVIDGFALEDVRGDYLVDFLSFFHSFNRVGDFVDFLWSYVFQGFHDDFVQVENLDVCSPTVVLLDLLRYCLLAGKRASNNRQLQDKVVRHLRFGLRLLLHCNFPLLAG